MSFDISLRSSPCSACGRGEEEFWTANLTHNVNRIVDLCLVAAGASVARSEEAKSYREWSWGRLDGWKAEDAAPILLRALAESAKPEREAEFEALEPSNGWGRLEGVRQTFASLHAECVQHPGATLSTSG